MTPEKQQLAMLKLCGYERNKSLDFMGNELWSKDGYTFYGERIPKYLNDLNAIAEARKTLTNNEQMQFIRYLLQIDESLEQCKKVDPARFNNRDLFIEKHLHEIGWDEAYTFLVNATAAQQCEAILRAKGLWEDES